MDTNERLRALILPEVEAHGAEVYDLELNGGVLKVTVEREGGIDLELIGSLTRTISRLLDEHDPIPSSFTLEVSSPGLERNLRTPAHFTGAVGEKVALKTRPDVDGDRRITGILVDADSDGVSVEDADGATRRLAYGDIDRARTVFDWGPTPKPGKGRSSKSTSTPKKAAKR